MVLSDEDITKFQALYESEFGLKITKEDAYEKGIKLLQLMSAIYKPMTQDEYELVQKHRKETISLLVKKLSNI